MIDAMIRLDKYMRLRDLCINIHFKRVPRTTDGIRVCMQYFTACLSIGNSWLVQEEGSTSFRSLGVSATSSRTSSVYVRGHQDERNSSVCTRSRSPRPCTPAGEIPQAHSDKSSTAQGANV